MALLELKEIDAQYGVVPVLRRISLVVEEGEVVSLIGANGAGKTTVLKTICALLTPVHGEVRFSGERIDRLKPFQIVRKGIAIVPEGRRLYTFMTVQENLQMGAFSRGDREVQADLEAVYQQFPILKERWAQQARNLSGGQQQMLAIARGLMARPRLLLMDEPSQGLAPIMIDTLCNIITDINRRGVAILLVEQNARIALELARRSYVLRTGEIVLEGSSATLQENELVQRAYLGGM